MRKNTHSFEALETVATADLANDYSSVAPNSQHSHEQDYAVGTQESKLYGCFDPRPNSCRHYDLIDESGVYPRTEMDVSVQVNEMTDAEFRKRVQSLNKEQMEFFYHVLHSIKSNSQPLKLFLSGGAGVGKSWVLNILFEAITRHFNRLPGEDPDELNVMKVAPTGKAAFNIGGNTLHSAFQIPANQGFQYTVLDSDRLYTMRNTYRKLKVLFIDDISMVGSGLLNFLNQRLQHIMGSKIAFGGINVIAVGDLFQLQPVFDKWVVENSSSEYSDLARNTWRDYFQLCELHTITRQREDAECAQLLNRLQEGHHTQDDINTLKRRIITSEQAIPKGITHLFITNVLVDSCNTTVFESSKDDKTIINAIDLVIGDVTDSV